MKKICLLLILGCLNFVGFAQTATSYTYSRATGTFTSISGGGGTVSTTALSGDDNVLSNIPIGFSFVFCGNTYTSLAACSNGFISLANSGSNQWTNSAANIAGEGFLMAFWDDLTGGNASETAYYQTSGTTPNRIFTFQWGMGTGAQRWSNLTGSGRAIFQVKLYESSNVIQYVYGAGTFTGNSATIGIANSTSDYRTITSATATTSGTTFSTAVAASPAANSVMTWTPPPTVIPSPSSLTFTTSISTTSTSQDITLKGFGFTSSPITVTAPANFQVYNGSAWVSSYTIATSTAAVGVYISATVPVRFIAPATVGTSTGNLTLTGGGLTTTNVSLTGNATNPCTGTPSAGTSSILPTIGGASTSFTLTETGYTIAGGITFQWQSSADASTWTNVTGATNPTYTFTGITANKYFRCNVTCTNSTITTTGTQCLATFLASASCNASYYYADATSSRLNNFSLTGYSGSTVNDNGPATHPANGYEDRTSAVTPVNLMQGNAYSGTVSYNTGNYYMENQIFIDFNNNGTFEASEIVTPVFAAGNAGYYYITSESFTMTIPLLATTGYHRMRIRTAYCYAVSSIVDPCNSSDASGNTFYYGTTRDYIANIIAAPACTGTPTAGTVAATQASGCSSYSTTLSLSGSSVSTGLTYQWESSPNNVTWTPIAGATSNTYSTSISTSTYYHSVVRCTASALSATTPSLLLAYATPDYAPLPVTETFESWMSICNNMDVPNNFWRNTPNTGNASWRRSDVSSSNNPGAWGSADSYSYSPGGSNAGGASSSYSARFHQGLTTGGGQGKLDLYVNLPAGTKQIKYDFITGSSTTGANNSIQLQVSTDGGSTFTNIGPRRNGPTGWTTVTETTTISSATAILRWLTTSDYGSYDIGLDNVNVIYFPACSGTPTAGATLSSSSAGCNSLTSNLSLPSSVTSLTGLTYQWQSSTDNATWGNISGATAATYTATATTNTYYRNNVTCATSGLTASATSTLLSIYAIPVITPTSTSLCVGLSATLTPTIAGGTWTSGNTAIATVNSSGMISGIGAGNTSIIYTVSPAGCTATSQVNVSNDIPTSTATVTPGTICSGGSATLNATLTATLPGYFMEAIPYSFTTPTSPTTISTYTSGADDGYASVNIPFTFNFWGTNYTTLYVGTNGYLTFGSSTVNRANYALPTTNMPATICFAMADLDVLSPGSITYSTVGSSPNRKFVITFDRIAPCCTYADENNAQIVLYETTNAVDILVSKSPSATRTIGIQNSAGTQAFAPTGRNGSTFSITPSAPEAYRFAKPTASYSWAPAAYLSTTTGSSVTATNITPTPTVTFTLTASYNGCTATTTKVVSVNPLPATIGGTLEVCKGLTTTLTNTSGAGTWSSANTAIATVVSGTGVVTGVAAGTARISYTLNSTGCVNTTVVTVNPLPAAITGNGNVCVNATTTLADASTGGTWTSGSMGIATAAAGTGVISGLTAGLAPITYTLPTGCIATTNVSVNPLPELTVSPSASAAICNGFNTTFTADAPVAPFSLLYQNFNTGLGTWTINSSGGSSASYWQLAAPGYFDATGDGSQLLQAAAFESGGAQIATILTSPSFSTVTYGSATLTFNQYMFSESDQNVAVEYSINGGSTWTTLLNQTNEISGSGAFDVTAPEVSIALPAAALGKPDVKLRWNYNASSFFWLIDNIAVSASVPPATYAWSGAAGLSCNACATTTITPTSIGANAYSVTATTSMGCTATAAVTVTVNPQPVSITGELTLCENATTLLANATTGGTWSSGATANATVNTASGLVSGVAAGTATITYTLPTGCITTTIVTMIPAPAAFTGTSIICQGSTTMLGQVTLDGTWSSSNTAVVPVSTTGIISGIALGTGTISYTIPNGCFTTRVMSVDPLPAAITGTTSVCEGLTTTLSNTDAGGTWSSSDAAVASVNATGEVSGNAYGNATITYTLPTGCYATKAVTVNSTPSSITGASRVCEASHITLSSLSPGGIWSTGDSATGVIDPAGIVTGNTAGNVTFTYSMNNGCNATKQVTVDARPAAITGTAYVCEAGTTALSDITNGGNWSTGAASIATVSASGLVSGITAGTVFITYALPATGCLMRMQVTVNPLPAAISGTAEVCPGLTTTVYDASHGGTWSTGAPATAAIDGAGIITGVAAGNANITYTLPTGCLTVTQATVHALPAAISGPLTVCKGLSTALYSAPAGGTWSLDNYSVASIDDAGTVTGVNEGNTNITYTLPTGCVQTATFVVNALPATITGASSLCVGGTTAMQNTTAGGAWSSLIPSVADIDATGTVTGYTAGNTIITYTTAAGCTGTKEITVNATPAAITGNTGVCQGLTTLLESATANGTWSTANAAIAATDEAGVVTGVAAGNADITYTSEQGCVTTTMVVVNPLPEMITGDAAICKDGTGMLYNASAGGSWTSGSPAIAAIDAVSGEITGMDAGNAAITYMLPTSCIITKDITINALPDAITGTAAVCEGLTTTLTSAATGGTWSSNNAATASIDNTGTVTGIAAGNTNIVYTLPTGCSTATAVTVNALPADITGNTAVCAGLTTTLSSNTPTGNWSSNAPAVATINNGGVVTGVNAGAATITYTLATGCLKTTNLSVNPLPAAITGNNTVCQGAATPLANATTGGAWSGSAPAIAAISASGMVTGLTAGAAIMTYTLPTGCISTSSFEVNPVPSAITGTAAVCAGATTTLTNTDGGGAWSSATTIASVNVDGDVTGNAAGTTTITYAFGTGCKATKVVTVNALPQLISGVSAICADATATLTNATAGGAWSSSNTAVAAVNATTGNITGVADGTANIIYTLPTGCARSKAVAVNPAVAPITGTTTICAGLTATLATATTGGTWSSSNTAVATVNTTTGLVAGNIAGNATIAYTMPTGCKAVTAVSIKSLPAAITGNTQLCANAATTLGNSLAGGSWTSAATGIATVNSTTGVVTAMSAGNTAITYTSADGCYKTAMVTVNPLPTINTVTGGGSYCAGTEGVHIGMDAAQTATTYRLYKGTVQVASATATSIDAIDFGTFTNEGTYTAVAVSDMACSSNMSGSADVTATPVVVPAVAVAADNNNTCAGTLINYTATVTNEGTAPAINWMVSGVSIGTGSTLAYTPADGAVVTAMLTSNATCALPLTATDAVTMHMINNVTPAVSIVSAQGNKVCQGAMVTINATAVAGGTAPAYTWIVDGMTVPVSGPSYSYIPAPGDQVICKLMSSEGCTTINNVQSNTITMTVDSIHVPVVHVIVTPGIVIDKDQQVSFATVVSNAGAAPTYQWMVNGINVTGATAPSFAAGNFNDGDSVTCMVTASGDCGYTTINSVTLQVKPTTGIIPTATANSDIRLIPNPNSGSFAIAGTLGTTADQEVSMEITDVLGQVIYKSTVLTHNGILNERIQLSNTIANGMYMMNLHTGSEHTTFRFVVKQ